MSRHSTRRVTVTVFLATLCLAASARSQGEPHLPNCLASTAAPGQVSIFAVPDGSGNTLTQAFLVGGAIVDATITVQLFDVGGAPVPGYPAEDIWLETDLGGLILCAGGSIADAPTAADGSTTFSVPLSAGGHSDRDAGELCVVMVDGLPMVGQELVILFNSPDIDGNLVVDAADLAIFDADFFGNYDYRSDFNFDGVISAADINFFTPADGAQCAGLGIVIINAEPTDAEPDAGWTLDGPSGFFAEGVGDSTFTDMEAGTYTLNWEDTPCWGEPLPNPDVRVLPAGGTISFAGVFVEYGTVRMMPEPVIIEPAWTLYGPAPFDSTSGQGQFTIGCLPPGEYTLQWFDFPGYMITCPNPDVQILPEGGDIVFACTYMQPGTINVDADPDALDAPWQLEGPVGYFLGGEGDTTLTDLVPGDYTLTWLAVGCWSPPDPVSELQALPEAGEITFAGTYVENGTVTIDAEPDAILAGWELSGPNAYFATGNGDTTIVCLPAGDYTLVWLEVDGWLLTCPDPELQTLDPGGAILFTCTYGPAGTIIVDIEPEDIGASWQLTGPDQQTIVADHDTTLASMPGGAYQLDWHDVPGWVAPIPNPDSGLLAAGDTLSFAGEYSPSPLIVSVTDVGNDQGRQLRIRWNRCLYDAPEDGVDITGYGIYRRQDEFDKSDEKGAERDPDDRLLERNVVGWDYITSVPARGDPQYQTVVPSLCDSTDINGICWSVYLISATTPDPLVFFDSRPDSGYSIDNLSPIAPQGIQVAFEPEGNVIAWEENFETDIREYRIYRSYEENGALDVCAPQPAEPLVSVGTTTWTDDLDGVPVDPWEVCYYLTAVDFSGNESVSTLWYDDVTATPDLQLPQQTVLHANVPNPFNPMTRIRFELPRASTVRLTIYDVGGRRVRTLIDGATRDAGRHEATWRGEDGSGRRVATGVYFYRLQTDGFDRTRRMVLIK